ncbi:asparagine synthetase B [Geomonas sp. Red276]
MCGICGIYGGGVERSLLESMMASMAHRGPDGAGAFLAPGIGLGHRRLSIIDLGSGSQPMSNEDDRLQVVFNGEIYNYIELKSALEKKGHRFKTASDTEVILHGYEEWGDGCLDRFNGMFAFALWDASSQRLLLARDHLGIKPLYYFTAGKTLFFASEIKALIRSRECPREVDLASLGDLFTYRYVPSPKTLFKGILKLPPGHLLSAGKDGIAVRRFWTWRPRIITRLREPDAIEQYQQLLEDAIRIQLRSDVPVGLFLSSGIDSGTILAVMARHIPSAIRTFTLGFEGGAQTNETDDARRMAERFGTCHEELIISPSDYRNYYRNYLWDLEEPVGNETAAAFYFVSYLTSQKVKVALTGQGADEPWAGYRRYLGVKLSTSYRRLPVAVRALLKKVVLALPRSEWMKRGVVSLDEPEVMGRFTKVYSFFSREMREQLFRQWVKEQVRTESGEVHSPLGHLQQEVSDLDPLSQMLYIDTRANLPDDLLMVNDKTAMANSLETRVPFLDYRVVEFVESLPPGWKLHGLQGKYLHKKAVEKWLPKEMVYRKKKGFTNPINEWLRSGLNDYVNDCLLAPDSSIHRYFDPDYVRCLIKMHTERREEFIRHLYLLISFEMWHRTFMKR